MSFPWRLEALTDATAKLIVQLRELERLRERVRKAEIVRRSRRVQSENRRSVSPT
jgi:hypothetical protein